MTTEKSGNTQDQKTVESLAKKMGVPNEVLLKHLREHGVELRSHLATVRKEDFQAVKEAVLAEKAKLDSRAKAQATKKASASKGAVPGSSPEDEVAGDHASVKERKGARITLKKAHADEKPGEKVIATPVIHPESTHSTPTPIKKVVEAITETVMDTKEKFDIPAEKDQKEVELVTPNVEPIPQVAPKTVIADEPVAVQVVPEIGIEEKSEKIAEPIVAPKILEPEIKNIKEIAVPEAAPAPVIESVRTSSSQLKATVEGPRADVLARIEKSKQQAQQAAQARARGRSSGPGYTGAFGKAPPGSEPAPRSGGAPSSRPPRGPAGEKPANNAGSGAGSSGPSSSRGPGGGASRGAGGRNTAMQDAFGAVNPRDLPAPADTGRSGGRGAPNSGKKGGKKTPVNKVEKRKEQIETVRQNVSRVMASLSKNPVRKTYRKEISAEGSGEVRPIIKVSDFISVGEFAGLMEQMPAKVIAKCMEMGMMVTINHRLDFETIQLLADEFGFDVELMEEYGEEVMGIEEQDDPAAQIPRAPVVTVMGHVDHGKTSLLDWIRKENVVAGESGGITQHIGAYEVVTPHGNITFLDTPGHEAFTAMRARGSQVTDVIVLVVAADSMVMPQTVECIELARNAKVPLVVAITKVDLPTANPDKIRAQLAERGVEVDQWGGNVSCVGVSSKTGAGMDRLLEILALETEVLELKANPASRAKGVVIESQLDRGKGSLATILIQNGTLRVGDIYVCGNFSGRVRAMLDERGRPRTEAGPSTPCVVLGFDGTPQAGDDLVVFADEKTAREIASNRRMAARERELRFRKNMSLEQVYDRVKSGESTDLNLIIKADVDGSAEALAASLEKVSNREVKVKVIRKAVGAITESDILLASTADAIIIAFHLLPSPTVREMAEREGVQIRTYRIIYEAIEDVQGVAEGLLKPIIREEVVGEAEIREVFKIPKIGLIAGCMVKTGEVNRESHVRVYRNGVEVGVTKVQSLKRHKDDASSVKAGLECGIGLRGSEDILEGDILAFFKEVSVARKMSDVKEEDK